MNIVSLELLTGPVPTPGGPEEIAKHFLRMARVEELHRQCMTANYVRNARRYLTHKAIGEILGHTEGWVRQYLKDTEGKKDLWDFAAAGFRGDTDTHERFWEDMDAAADLDQRLHLCAEYGLSNAAVAQVLRVPESRAAVYMDQVRAEVAA